MNNKLIIMLLVLFVTGTSNLFSQNMNKRTEETPQTVIANVHKAAELLKEKGSEALAVLTDPKSDFNDRDAYLFIIDVDKSLVVSNPRFPERTGGNIREHLDWSGKYYGVELCEVAMRGRHAWRRLDRIYLAEAGYRKRLAQNFLYLSDSRNALYSMRRHLQRFHDAR